MTTSKSGRIGALNQLMIVLGSTMTWVSFVTILSLLLLFGFFLLIFLPKQRVRKIIIDALQRCSTIPLFFLWKVNINVQNLSLETFKRQFVIICNHQSLLDLLIIIANVPNLSILMKQSFKKNILFRCLASLAGYHFTTSDEQYTLLNSIEQDINAGYNLLIFPEGTRSKNGQIGELHKGAFSIARYFKLSILPLYIDGSYEVLPKGCMIARSGDIRLEILPPFDHEQYLLKQNIKRITKQVQHMYQKLQSQSETVLVIGGGMGGLFVGALLSEIGYKVTVVEKNHIIGGGLQSFRRGDAIFNTGLHNFGGWSDEWALSKILTYLDIKQHLHVMACDENAQEIVYTSSGKCYHLPKGRENFEKYLSTIFVSEAQGIHKFIEAIHLIAYSFDHYMMRQSMPHPEVEQFNNLTAGQLIDLYIKDAELRELLCYLTPMCGQSINNIPVSVFSMLTVIYIAGEYRFVDNSLQLATALATKIELNGGLVLPDTEIKKIEVVESRVISATSSDGRSFKADKYISAIAPKELFSFTDAPIMRKVTRNRIDSFTAPVSAMSIFIELKENTFPFINSTILLPSIEQGDGIPHYILLTTPPEVNQGPYAHTIEILSPVRYNLFKNWEDTICQHRGKDYEVLKEKICANTIEYISKYYPTLPQSIKKIYSATPLTIRDYYHNPWGAVFCQQGLYLPLGTRTYNLFLTGQSVLYHGLCGVPLTAILTAQALSGKDLLTEINNANNQQ